MSRDTAGLTRDGTTTPFRGCLSRCPDVKEEKSTIDLVELKGGPLVLREALHLAIDLEVRGIQLTAEGGRLTASPRDLVTDADAAQIRPLKAHLLAIVDYCERFSKVG